MIEHIQIGPVRYAVREKDDLHTVDGEGKKEWLNGHVVYSDAEIRVNHEMARDVKVACLWHEAIHALLYNAGQDGVPEAAVRALGYGIVQLIRDNPELMRMTTEARGEG